MRRSKGRRTTYTWPSLQEKERVLSLAKERTGSDEFQGLVTEALKTWEGKNPGPRLPAGLPPNLNDEEVEMFRRIVAVYRQIDDHGKNLFCLAINGLLDFAAGKPREYH